MTQALILVNGFAASDDELAINALVTLANDNAGGELTYLWSITAQPPGATDSLSSTTTLATTFTPKKEGNYRIQVIVNQGLGTERVATAIVGVLQVRSQNSQPAAGETTELGPQGWAPRMNQTIRLVDQLNADPGSFICVTTAGAAVGSPVVISGAQVIMVGLPGETTVPTVAVVDAAVAADVAGAVGVILATVDGGAVGPGSLVYVRMNGLASVPVTGSPAAGTRLVAAGSPTATIVDIATVGSNPYRYVGVSCGLDPIVGANTLIAWAGAGAQSAGGSSSSALFEWNGINDTQYSDNPLPAPSVDVGATNPELNVTALSISPSQFQLAISADDMTNGAALWWANPLVPFASIKQLEARFGRPQPGIDPTTTEHCSIGFIVAGDDATNHAIVFLLDFAGDGAGNIVTTLYVYASDPTGPTITYLLIKVLPAATEGYFWRMVVDLQVARNNTAYGGAPGSPSGTMAVRVEPWALPPTTGFTSPDGGLAIFNPVVFPIGTSFATSACNKVGVIMIGNWTAASGPQTGTIFQMKITG